MSPTTPEQARRQALVEDVLALAHPVLDLILAVGDRISRLAAPPDSSYVPPHLPARDQARRAVAGAGGDDGGTRAP